MYGGRLIITRETQSLSDDFESPLTAFLQTVVVAAIVALLQEDVASIGAGMFVAEDRWGLVPVVLGAGLGTAVGDLLWIMVGRRFGPPALKRQPLKWLIKGRHIERWGSWIGERATSVVVVSRFLPGFRTPAHLALGLSRIELRRILPYVILSAFLYVGLLTALAAAVGTVAGRYLPQERIPLPLVLGVLAIVFLLLVKLAQRLVGAKVWALFQRREPQPKSTLP